MRKTSSCGGARRTVHLLLFISPWLVGFTLFTIGPMAASVYLSMTDYSIVEPPRWVGFHNYAALFRGWDPDFYNSIRVTITYAVIYVPATVFGALLLAMGLTVGRVRLMSIYRTLFFLPALMPAVASAIIWAWAFDPRYGLINTVYRALFHSPSPDWLGDPKLALLCLVIMSIWGGIGFPMVVFIAGLQGVPQTLLEASLLDGANAWNRFRHVVFPQISPVVFFNLIVTMVGALQVFTLAFVFGQANAVNRTATQFYVLHIYDEAFGSSRFGLACALAWLLVMAVMVLTATQFALKRRWVVYNA